MSENIGGISLDDILAAASFDDESNSDSENTEIDVADTEDVIGGVKLSDIMSVASLDEDDAPVQQPSVQQVVVNSLAKEPEIVVPKPVKQEETVKNIVAVSEPATVISESTVDVYSNATDDNDVNVTDDNDVNVIYDNASVDVADPNDDIAKAEKKAEIVAKLRKFYVFDFLYRTVKAKNWGLLVWLFMNFIFIEFAAMTISMIADSDGGYAGIACAIAPLAYMVTLAIALSPVGEFVLRQQNSCRKIKNKQIEAKVQPIFDKVYAEAREKNPNISPNVKLFMCDEESENAFATGRRTVCITKGLTNMSEEHIAGILAHEFGHLANKDTDNLLIVVVGNIFVSIITGLLGIFFNICGAIGDKLTEDTTLGRFIPFHVFTKILSFIFVTAFMFVWTKIGVLLCLRGNKKAEFAADMYAAELGYAQELVDAFEVLDDSPAPKGLWAALTSSHPQTADRVMKLNEYIESHQQNALN